MEPRAVRGATKPERQGVSRRRRVAAGCSEPPPNRAGRHSTGCRAYAATYTVEGDMVHVKTHTETRSVALSGKSPEDVARRELKEIVEASRRH